MGTVTNPACSWAVCRGVWVRKVGALSGPQEPGQAASHFSNRSAEESLLEPVFLELLISSPPQPIASSFPMGRGAASSEV